MFTVNGIHSKRFISTYRDGQVHCDLRHVFEDTERGLYVRARLDSYSALFELAAFANALTRQDLRDDVRLRHILELDITYLIGMRSDQAGRLQSLDIETVCSVINSVNAQSVRVLCPHSPVTTALLERSMEYSMISVWAGVVYADKDCVLVSPDAGAYKRLAHDTASRPEVATIAAIKYRDVSGPHVTFTGSVEGKHCVIVDDLCDGGRTFTELAGKLKAAGATKVTLCVTHGLFTNGLDFLYENGVDHICTTNSYADWEPTSRLSVLKVI